MEPQRKRRRAKEYTPVINSAWLRIDWPTRDRSPANLLKFAAFLAVLLGLFMLLYHLQWRFLTSMNARAQTPALNAKP